MYLVAHGTVESYLRDAYRYSMKYVEDVPLYYDIVAQYHDLLDENDIRSLYSELYGTQLSKWEIRDDIIIFQTLQDKKYEYIDAGGFHINDCQNILIREW